jgi:hypothetical protein
VELLNLISEVGLIISPESLNPGMGWERRVWDYEHTLNEMNGKVVFPLTSLGAFCDSCNPWKIMRLMCKYGVVR